MGDSTVNDTGIRSETSPARRAAREQCVKTELIMDVPLIETLFILGIRPPGAWRTVGKAQVK